MRRTSGVNLLSLRIGQTAGPQLAKNRIGYWRIDLPNHPLFLRTRNERSGPSTVLTSYVWCEVVWKTTSLTWVKTSTKRCSVLTCDHHAVAYKHHFHVLSFVLTFCRSFRKTSHQPKHVRTVNSLDCTFLVRIYSSQWASIGNRGPRERGYSGFNMRIEGLELGLKGTIEWLWET